MSAFKYRDEKDCLNCGHEVEEKFCSRCGQENIVVKENAFKMVTHAIADYFHFEHKFFATMGPLLFKPGQLTKQYVEGKRARFIHPIRLYIFISIVFFLVVLSIKEKDNKDPKSKTELAKDAKTKKERDSITREEVRQALEGIPMDDKSKKAVDAAMQKAVDADDDNEDSLKVKTKWSGVKESYVYDIDTTYEAYLNRVSKLPKDKQPGSVMKYMAKSQIKFRGEEGKKKFIESLLHNIPKMMFLLLPLFAAILHIVYIRKKKYYYEDLIYSFHLHSCIFLAILFYQLINWFISYVVDIQGWLVLALIIYIIWYIYRSLRVFYNSSRWRTVLKLMFLSFAYIMVLTLCLIVVVLATVVSM